MQIEEVKYYRLKVSAQEMKAIRDMLAEYDPETSGDSEAMQSVRAAFGVKPTSPTEVEEEEGIHQETLPERALRISSGKRTGSGRKSILTSQS